MSTLWRPFVCQPTRSRLACQLDHGARLVENGLFDDRINAQRLFGALVCLERARVPIPNA
jgi:hypothetical protein